MKQSERGHGGCGEQTMSARGVQEAAGVWLRGRERTLLLAASIWGER